MVPRFLRDLGGRADEPDRRGKILKLIRPADRPALLFPFRNRRERVLDLGCAVFCHAHTLPQIRPAASGKKPAPPRPRTAALRAAASPAHPTRAPLFAVIRFRGWELADWCFSGVCGFGIWVFALS